MFLLGKSKALIVEKSVRDQLIEIVTNDKTGATFARGQIVEIMRNAPEWTEAKAIAEAVKECPSV